MDAAMDARHDARLEAAKEAEKEKAAQQATPRSGPAAMEVDVELSAADLGDLGSGTAAPSVVFPPEDLSLGELRWVCEEHGPMALRGHGSLLWPNHGGPGSMDPAGDRPGGPLEGV